MSVCLQKNLLLTLGLLALGAASVPAQEVDTARAAVVKISGTRGGTPVRGSGFVVSKNRNVATIVTASHVIQGAEFEVRFAAAPTERFPVDAVLGMEAGNPNGLAVLQVRGAIPPGVETLSFDVENRPRADERLVLIGYPQMTLAPLTKRRSLSGRRGTLLLLDLSVGEGFSGGPVLRGGKVVGVVTGEDSQLTYAVNAVVAGEALRGWGVRLGSSGTSTIVQDICRPGEEIVDQGITFVRICPGTFTMGSAENDSQAFDDEKPAHEVTLSEYWIGKYEFTNAQYHRFRPGHQGEANLPVTQVSWSDANAFCENFGFQLPTEAQWEYAARAGSQTAWSFGDDESKLGRYAWFRENSGSRAHPAGTKDANTWGLHDMHGNVWEWVADWYGTYPKEAQVDPTGPPDGTRRVVRGGGFNLEPRVLRSAYRYSFRPEIRLDYLGFRCVRRSRPEP